MLVFSNKSYYNKEKNCNLICNLELVKGIELWNIVSHRYVVAVSRVTFREWLKILIKDEDDEDTNVTSNVVYEKVFRNLRWNNMPIY